ncbi:MAG: phosphate/phosphite/phosphonate ABC transporter substrate-binding protein [Synechococcales bacterium]|nr:phosphate/phosphite/phosphonate ABC transporter substrate-binding protein [Synechococcales bacterium]
MRRLLLIAIATFIAVLIGCTPSDPAPIQKLTMGVVSYDTGARSMEQYQPFKDYLAAQTRTIIELEPAYNELQALEQIRRRSWSLVFAPPGLAAIAIQDAQYLPMFPLQGANNARSVLLVKNDSPLEKLDDLAGNVLALGEPGSATGYYLPLYDLYGLTLEAVRFAPTPKTVLQWVQSGEVDAGAVAEEDFLKYRNEFGANFFRVLHSSRAIPRGSVLIGPSVDRNQQRLIDEAMRNAPSNIIADAGYIPNAPVPVYDEVIRLIDRVRPLDERVRQSPAVLTTE